MDKVISRVLDFIRGNLPTTTYASGDTVPSSKPSPTFSPTPKTKTADTNGVADKIRAGYRTYSGGKEVPMEQYIPLMVMAANKYPIFQKNPYLLPAVSIVETSAGQNWKLNNNPLSWAARVQKAGNYSPKSPEQSIADMISAVGGDPDRGAGFAPDVAKTRQAQTAPYEKFRNSNNLQDFATTYEDASNTAYYPALLKAMEYFK